MIRLKQLIVFYLGRAKALKLEDKSSAGKAWLMGYLGIDSMTKSDWEVDGTTIL